MNKNQFTFTIDGSHFQALRLSDKATAIRIEPNPWESDFFDRRFGRLVCDVSGIKAADEGAQTGLWQAATRFADDSGYDIIEMELDITGFDLVPFCEDIGFRLVDSKISFFTQIEKSGIQRFKVKNGRIGQAKPADLDAIIALTQTSFVENPYFFSRFKNPRYFSRDESRAYYAAWITNHFSDPKSLFAVWRDRDQCIGYYFFRHHGQHESYPVYKGMLAAVDRRYQNQKAHAAMQTYLFDQIPDPIFLVDNTTQLTNFPVIKNHVTSQRSLSAMRLVFYRQRRGPD